MKDILLIGISTRLNIFSFECVFFMGKNKSYAQMLSVKLKYFNIAIVSIPYPDPPFF